MFSPEPFMYRVFREVSPWRFLEDSGDFLWFSLRHILIGLLLVVGIAVGAALVLGFIGAPIGELLLENTLHIAVPEDADQLLQLIWQILEKYAQPE